MPNFNDKSMRYKIYAAYIFVGTALISWMTHDNLHDEDLQKKQQMLSYLVFPLVNAVTFHFVVEEGFFRDPIYNQDAETAKSATKINDK